MTTLEYELRWRGDSLSVEAADRIQALTCQRDQAVRFLCERSSAVAEAMIDDRANRDADERGADYDRFVRGQL
jgi:hypothetical protein